MTERSDHLAATAIDAVYRGAGVAKSAAGTARMQVTEAVIRNLCDLIGIYDESVAYTTRVLKAIQASGEENTYRGITPYHPQEWRVGLQPNVPQHRNGFHFPDGRNDEQAS